MKKQREYMKWYLDYQCPGGDCGLTCCTKEWKISISEQEYEKYKSMEHPLRDEILEGIDEKEMRFKCSEGKCVLLDEKGFCKIVLNCGDSYLTKTCTDFPRGKSDFGIAEEYYVEISCPLVAELLFDEKKIEFEVIETEEEQGDISEENKNLVLSLDKVRKTLIELFQEKSGQYIFGKMYINEKVLSEVLKEKKDRFLSEEKTEEILEKYTSKNIVQSLFNQLEAMSNMFDAREKTIYRTLCELNESSLIGYFSTILTNKFDYIIPIFEIWFNDENEFKKDLQNYIEYGKERFRYLSEKFLCYSIYIELIKDAVDEFGEKYQRRMIELLLIHIFGMMLLREYGDIDEKLFAVCIAGLDRNFAHSDRVKKELNTYIQNKIQENSDYFLLTVVI